MGGRSVELLFSVTLGLIAEKKGIALVLEDKDDQEATFKFFVSLLYLAALNAWEFESLDNPGIGEFPFKAIDFAEWATANRAEFTGMITASAEAMAGLVGKGAASASDIKKK